MEIKQARIEDLAGMTDLFDAYRVFYKQPSDKVQAEAFIKQRLENEDSVIFLAKNADTYLGFTQLYPSFSSVAMKRLWVLNDLFVAPEARRQGVAEALMNKAEAFAKETGAKSIALKTAKDNKQAKGLYDKLGYLQDAKFDHYELNTME